MTHIEVREGPNGKIKQFEQQISTHNYIQESGFEPVMQEPSKSLHPETECSPLGSQKNSKVAEFRKRLQGGKWPIGLKKKMKDLEASLPQSVQPNKDFDQIVGIRECWNSHIKLQNQTMVSLLRVLIEVEENIELRQTLSQTWSILSDLHKGSIEATEKMHYELSKIEQCLLAAQQAQIIRKELDQARLRAAELENRCQVIRKILNESEEKNYQLRLEVQDAQIKARLSNSKAEAYAITVQEQQVKIEQLEVIKKQCLRAYSKVKSEKQELELRLLDAELETQKKGGQRTEYCQAEGTLNMIVQNSEQEPLEEPFRSSDSEASLTAIRQLIERGLMEINRSTSQRCIKSALVKIQQLEHLNDVHKKYELLAKTQQKLSFNQGPIEIMECDFSSFVEKLIQFNSKPHKITEEVFDKIANKVFETLCNLPAQGDEGLFFTPSNSIELEDAVDSIYQFSLRLDDYHAEARRVLQDEAIGIMKVLEQISICKGVSAQMMIGTVRRHLDEPGSISKAYFKELIMKLSTQSVSKQER